MQNITTIHGKNMGKTIAILAGVHGNEQGGIPAIQEAISSIPIERGTVHYIIGNPRALEQNVRFTEMNLNRAFIRGPLKNPALEETYERKRALELMPLLDACDALLDIHTVTKTGTPPFIICEPEYFSLAKKLPFSIVSHGWTSIEPGSTDYYMKTAKKPGICIECGQHKDQNVPTLALASIRIFLQIMGNISGLPLEEARRQKVISVTDILITKTNFQLARKFYDFEPVVENELLGHDGGKEYRAPRDGVVVFARNTSRAGEEAIVFGTVA